jgi:tetratricopeptide (TPR) repeat protein
MIGTARRLALVAFCFCGVASANRNERLAGEKHNLAMRLFDLGRYEDAIGALEEGYLLNPRPSFIYNRAMMLNRMGDLELRFDRTLARRHYVGAADSFRHYLDRQPNAPDEADVRFNIAGLYNFADRLRDRPKPQDGEDTRERAPAIDERARPGERASEGRADRDRRSTDAERDRKESRFRLIWGLVTAGGVGLAFGGFGILNSAKGMDADIYKLRLKGLFDEADIKSDDRGALTGAGVALTVIGSLALAAGVTLLSLPTRTRIRLFATIGGIGGVF